MLFHFYHVFVKKWEEWLRSGRNDMKNMKWSEWSR